MPQAQRPEPRAGSQESGAESREPRAESQDATRPSPPLKIALLGFGTVGASVARILVERPELADRLRLTHVFNRGVSRKRADWVPDSVVWTDRFDEVLAGSPDVVVEVVGGVTPAREWVSQAIAKGASVVTANKML